LCRICAALRTTIKNQKKEDGCKKLLELSERDRKILREEKATRERLKTLQKEEIKRTRKIMEKLKKKLDGGNPTINRTSAEHELVQLVHKAISKSEDVKTSWVYQVVTVQLRWLTSDSSRMEWPLDYLHWSYSLHFYGGQRVMDYLRGKAYQGQGKGKLENDPQQWCLYFPSTSTLRSHLPPVNVYAGIADSSIEKLGKAMDRKGTVKKVVLSFDEMEVRSGLIYLKSKGVFVGATKIIKEEEATEQLISQLASSIVRYVFQIFATSLDGSATWPLGYLGLVLHFCNRNTNIDLLEFTSGTTKATGKYTHQVISDLINRLSKYNFEVIATSSDGYSGVLEYVKLLKETHPTVYHVFDYSHLVKNIRNYLLRPEGVSFSGYLGKCRISQKQAKKTRSASRGKSFDSNRGYNTLTESFQ